MAVDMGSAQGSLTLDASAFFASVQSSIQEIHNLHDAAQQASSGVNALEGSLSGAGGAGAGLSGAMSGVENAASAASTGVENVGTAAQTAGNQTLTFRDRLASAWQYIQNALPDTEALTKKLDEFGKKAEGVGKSLTKYITTPLAGIGIYSVKTSMSFEKAMSQVAATMGVSIDDIQDLTEAAKKMGEETQFTNIEAAQALNYLALAGYDSEQMIAALPNVLNLAAAGGMDLAKASDMLTDGLSALNLASRDSETLMGNMSTMVDQMARTASRSNTSVAQLGDAILTVGGTASYLHDGLSETNQVIGLLADRGIKASEAGTHLRNIILALNTDVGSKAGFAFKEMGLVVEDADGKLKNLAFDAEGNLKPLQEIFAIMQEGMKGMTDEEKLDALGRAFHRTDLAAVNALLGTSQERWQELADEIDNAAGAGSQMAATQLNNLSGQLTLLKSKLDSVATSIGEILAPQFSKVLDGVSKVLDKFKELDPETQKSIVNFGLIAAAIGPVVTVLGKVSLAVSGVIKGFRAIGLAISNLAPTISAGIAALGAPVTASLGTLLTGVGAFLAGYGIGTLIYNAFSDEIDSVLYPLFDGVVAAWDIVTAFFTAKIPAAVIEGINHIKNAVSVVVSVIPETASQIWDTITGIISAIPAWFTTSVILPVYNTFSGFVQSIVTKAHDIVTGITSVTSSIVNSVVQTAQNLWDSVVSIWVGFIDWWTNHITTPITESVTNLINTISEYFTTAYNNVTGAFETAGDFFTGVWNGIKDVFSTVGTWFKTVFTTAWEGIKSAFSTATEFFSGIWENIKSLFSDSAIIIGDAFNSAFTSAFNAIMSGVEDSINFFIDGLNDVVDVINNIPGVDISKLDRLELPRLAVGLDYVPYDNYGALLHKGERVLTAEENEAYNSGRYSGGDTFIFNSPEPIDERTAAQEMKRAKQELAEGF